ncbi:MAG TPA: dienelactone hydrolase family protein [Chitinophagaceae bacterium]|nr:dienelactone hydrolase family protein [Chitinophagaceae bacterium]
MKWRRHIGIVLLFCSSGLNIFSQQSEEKFIQATRYLLYLPDGYTNDTTQHWPLLIFLHGSGETGQDIQKVKLHGPPELVEKGKKFPFIIVSPQNEGRFGWEIESLQKLLGHLKNTQRINPKKIYLTGLSMGGYGTWEWAMKYPEEFAAIAPVCGGGDTTNAWKLRNIPAWVFHGAKDDVVLPVQSQNMVNASRRYGAAITFTLYPEANHNSWDSAYNNNTLYSWLLEQSKFNYSEKTVSPGLLKKYQGKYIGPDQDTVKIEAKDNELRAYPGRDTVPLKVAGENLFFIEPAKNMDIRFIQEKNKITGFLFMGDRKLFYRRL